LIFDNNQKKIDKNLKMISMKRFIAGIIMLTSVFGAKAQNAYEIKVNIKGIKDSVCYLLRYKWDSQYIADTAKVKNGSFTFKGKKPLEKGLYAVLRQSKSYIYFDMPIAESQKFSVVTDTVELYNKMKIAGSQLNEDFRQFVLFMSSHYKAAFDYEKEVKARKDKDSTKLIIAEKTKQFEEIKKYQKEYIAKNPASYLNTIIYLQSEVEVPPAPTLANGRKDSTWQYRYYVQHYWDGIPLNDVGTLNTNKLFYNKLKNYFEKVLVQAPDSLIKACDWLIKQAGDNKEMFKYMVYYTTFTTESSKIMGHDAVFVDLVDKYYRTGKAYWLDQKQLDKIIERADILKPLILGKIAPDMDMVDTAGAKTIHKLGIDTITSSEHLTQVYFANQQTLQSIYVPLHKIKADWTILIFWDVDCGHCQKDLPKLRDIYNEYKKEGKSVEVYAVYTHHEVEKWKKFIRDNKLSFINVYDGVHLNDLKKKFDIFSTPVIYLLDKNKVIKAKRIGVEQVEDVIKNLSLQDANKK
jgi:thiol-disulfide isomerase/thioredoxin